MPIIRLLCMLIWWCLLLVPARAQEGAVRHSWVFAGVPLEQVLEQLEEGYSVRFAYSRDYLPMQEPVSATLSASTLEEALAVLMPPRNIRYRRSGRQVLLRRSGKEVQQLSQKTPPSEVPQQTPLYTDQRTRDMLAAKRRLWRQQLPLLARNMASLDDDQPRQLIPEAYILPIMLRRRISMDSVGLANLEANSPLFVSLPEKKAPPPPSLEAGGNDQPGSRLAQISLLPYVGTNLLQSTRTTNNVSVNVVWGTNGGVEGMEVGGLGNSILGSVQGIQVAGLVNTVSQHVVGTQIAGLSNMVRGNVQGVQLSGVLNRAGSADAIQLAAGFNIVEDDFSGVQVGMLFNAVGGQARGVQVAPFFNTNGGNGRVQIAGLFNRADTLSLVQVAPLVNVARHNKGLQLGLINVADTASGVPIGLLNLVRRGYNRVEIATGETFFGNVGIKIGVRRFYNIFYVGGRSAEESGADGETIRANSWSLGYGLGSSIRLGQRFHLDLELISMHVNEKEDWTTELNQLTQFRVLFDGRIGNRISAFAGPVANLMVSRLTNPQDGTIGTSLAPYTLYDETRNGTNTKMWIGVQAGLRF